MNHTWHIDFSNIVIVYSDCNFPKNPLKQPLTNFNLLSQNRPHLLTSLEIAITRSKVIEPRPNQLHFKPIKTTISIKPKPSLYNPFWPKSMGKKKALHTRLICVQNPSKHYPLSAKTSIKSPRNQYPFFPLLGRKLKAKNIYQHKVLAIKPYTKKVHLTPQNKIAQAKISVTNLHGLRGIKTTTRSFKSGIVLLFVAP